MINNHWILEFRTDELTTLFKYFPLLASDYFYISVIALGYWLKPHSLIFRSLGFLIPFSTLLNCLFKNFFQIERPDISLHLITVQDPFGFPSGDVQVSGVFWGYILMNIQNRVFRYLCFIPIIGIAISRVYLGVHRVYDVIGALIIAGITVYVWKRYLEPSILKNATVVHPYIKYWILLISVVIVYAAVSMGLKWPPMVPMAIGALIGFGLSLQWLMSPQLQNKMHLLSAISFLSIMIAVSFMFPILKINTPIYCLNLIFKFSVLTISIFYLIPKLYARLASTIHVYRS